MKFTHYVGGGVQEAHPQGTIGGSYHVITIESEGKQYKMLLDIGNQPSNAGASQMQNPFRHFDIASLHLAFISHTHQDHIGNCIRLVQAGYRGPIYMSEVSKTLAKVIFDDALKHEEEEVKEYNAKIIILQRELHDAWALVHGSGHNTTEAKNTHDNHHDFNHNPHHGVHAFEEKISDLLRDFRITKTQYRKRLREILVDSSISIDEFIEILRGIHPSRVAAEHAFTEQACGLKQEILTMQHTPSHGDRAEAIYKLRKHNIHHPDDISALREQLTEMEFDENDVMQALEQIKPIALHEKTAVIPGVLDLTLFSAGHVEGAVQSVWDIHEGGETRTFAFTGDIGRFRQPSLTGKPDTIPATLDYMITEGTYAGRHHADRHGEIDKIIHDINTTKHICLIPVFALQRLQDVLSVIIDAVHSKKLQLHDGEKIYCHSPLAYNLTNQFILNDKTGAYKNLRERELIQWISNPQEMLTAMSKPGRKIIMCSGGMLEKGTVVQYIDKVHADPDSSIVLTGFQVPGTSGHKLINNDFARPIYLNNKVVRSNAAHIGYYPLSGHADNEEIVNYIGGLHYAPNAQVTIVHGGPARHDLATEIKAKAPNVMINVPDENGLSFTMEW